MSSSSLTTLANNYGAVSLGFVNVTLVLLGAVKTHVVVSYASLKRFECPPQTHPLQPTKMFDQLGPACFYQTVLDMDGQNHVKTLWSE